MHDEEAKIAVRLENLRQVVAKYRAAEARGPEKVQEVLNRIPRMWCIPEIAQGRVLPEVVARCCQSQVLVNQIATLPVDEQQRILNTGTMRASRRQPDGSVVVEDVPLHEITDEQAKEVFASVSGSVRSQGIDGYGYTPEQQRSIVAEDRSGRVAKCPECGSKLNRLVSREINAPKVVLDCPECNAGVSYLTRTKRR